MNKRKKILIYPKFQIPLIVINIVVFFSVTALQLIFSHKAFSNFKELGETAGFDASSGISGTSGSVGRLVTNNASASIAFSSEL